MDVNVDSISNMPTNYDYINNIGKNPWSILFLSVVILVYYLIFATLGGNSNSQANGDKPIKSFMFLEIILWGVFLALLLLNGIQYFFNIDVTATIKNFFSPEPQIDIEVDNLVPADVSESSVPEITERKQVFHVPGNTLVYDDAKALCKAYGARLANYDEIEKAYNAGGEWCSYGWSDNQQALFPTQRETWEKLQKIDGHQHDCGRTGINGGFIANPMVRFGANCYGFRPKITSAEEKSMEINEDNFPPPTKRDIEFQRRVDYWRQHLPEVTVAPFNRSTWSKI